MRKYFKFKLIIGILLFYIFTRYFLIETLLLTGSGDDDSSEDASTSKSDQRHFYTNLDAPIEKSSQLDDYYNAYQIFTDNLINKNYLEYRLKSTQQQHESSANIANQEQRENDVHRKFYVILEYTDVFYTHKYCNLKLKNKELSDHSLYRLLYENSQQQQTAATYDLLDECLYTNCFFTCDQSLLKYTNVVLFHETDLKEDLFRRYQMNEEKMRQDFERIAPVKERTRSKIWLLWNDEANSVDSALDMFQFNWTMSYKSNSEVSYGAYGVYKYKLNPELTLDRDQFFAKLKAQFHKRSSQAIWFNSNCKSHLRMEYAQNMSIGYPIKVFGKCNEMTREAMSNKKNRHYKLSLNDTQCARDAPCEHEALKENKFFLAFESKNCSDYITEKYWRSLSFAIIPIVLQPAKKYYERLAPPNSYIHLQDFDYDVRRLVTHLKLVSSDFNEYKKYFEWKLKYEIIHDMRLEKLRMCELCSKLNKETSEISYKSVSKFFNDECVVN